MSSEACERTEALLRIPDAETADDLIADLSEALDLSGLQKPAVVRTPIDAILHGDEAGVPAVPAAFGTEAVIEDFGTGDDGLLTLQVRGARRFHVERVRVRDNGLQVGDVRWCDPDIDDPLRPEHGLLSTILQTLLERVGGEHSRAPSAKFDEAAWVGWRLAEMLPLEDRQRQQLLQMHDPHERHDWLLSLLD